MVETDQEIVACEPSIWRTTTDPSGARSSMLRGLGLPATINAVPFHCRRVPSYSVNDDSRDPAGPLGITRTTRSPDQVRTFALAVGISESYSGASGMIAPARAKTGALPSSGAGTVTSW